MGGDIWGLSISTNPGGITFAETAPKLKPGREFQSCWNSIQLPFEQPCGSGYSQTICVLPHIDSKMKPFWEQSN